MQGRKCKPTAGSSLQRYLCNCPPFPFPAVAGTYHTLPVPSCPCLPFFHSIMEMDPNSAAFQRIFSNVFAYTAFKSTEPWLVDYVTLDLHASMKQVGLLCHQQAVAYGDTHTPTHAFALQNVILNTCALCSVLRCRIYPGAAALCPLPVSGHADCRPSSHGFKLDSWSWFHDSMHGGCRHTATLAGCRRYVMR